MHKSKRKVFQFLITIQQIYLFYHNHLHSINEYFSYFNQLLKLKIEVKSIINLMEAIN